MAQEESCEARMFGVFHLCLSRVAMVMAIVTENVKV